MSDVFSGPTPTPTPSIDPRCDCGARADGPYANVHTRGCAALTDDGTANALINDIKRIVYDKELSALVRVMSVKFAITLYEKDQGQPS